MVKILSILIFMFINLTSAQQSLNNFTIPSNKHTAISKKYYVILPANFSENKYGAFVYDESNATICFATTIDEKLENFVETKFNDKTIKEKKGSLLFKKEYFLNNKRCYVLKIENNKNESKIFYYYLIIENNEKSDVIMGFFDEKDEKKLGNKILKSLETIAEKQ